MQKKLMIEKAIYVTSDQAFEKYCKGCACLVNDEPVGKTTLPHRVHCGVETCSKNAAEHEP